MCGYGSCRCAGRQATTAERVNRLEAEYEYLAEQARKKLDEIKAMVAEGSDKLDEPTV